MYEVRATGESSRLPLGTLQVPVLGEKLGLRLRTAALMLAAAHGMAEQPVTISIETNGQTQDVLRLEGVGFESL
jgi:hypothetical protein